MADEDLSPDVAQIPLILRDNTEINIADCIDNLHAVLLLRKRISANMQLILENTITNIVADINVANVSRGRISLPTLEGDTSSDSQSGGSISSSSVSESAGEAQNIEVGPNINPNIPAEVPLEEIEENEEIEEINLPVKIDLMRGQASFRKYVDLLREELLVVFVPEITERPLIHFNSHKDMKLAVSKILRCAQIWRQRELDRIFGS